MAHSRLLLRLAWRIWLTAIVAVAIFSSTEPAMAEGNAVLVGRFQGSKPQGLRELAVKLLEADGFTVASGGEALSGDSGEYEIVRTARESHAVAVVLVTTGLTKTSWRSTVTVRDGATGKSVGEATLTGKSYKGLQKAYKENLVTELMPLFQL